VEATLDRATAPYLRRARWSTSVLFFLNGAIVATWATRLPTVQSSLKLSTSELGIALLGAAVGALAAMNLSGYLSARFGSKPVTLIAALGLYGVLAFLGLAPTLPILVGTLVFFGASNGSMDVAMNAQGVSVERHYGRPILNSFHAFFSLGGLTGAVVGGLFAYYNIPAFEHFLGVAVVCAVVTAIVARFLLPGDAAAQKTSVKFVLPSRAILVLGLVAFCVVLGEGAMADWTAIYLNGTVRTGAGLAAAGYAAFSISMALGRGVGDALTARVGPGIMMQLGGLVAAAGLALGLVTNWVALALLGFALVGIGYSVVFPLALSVAGRTSTQAAGMAIATVATCGYVGFLLGPPVIGFIADALSLRVALGLVALLSLCAVLGARTVRVDKPTVESLGDLGAERTHVEVFD